MEMEWTFQKSRRDKNTEKELQELKEDPKMKIHLDLFRSTLKIVPDFTMPGNDAIYRFLFKTSLPSTTDWL